MQRASTQQLREILLRSHEVDYEILGHDIQMVEITLDPDEAVIAEAGAMTYMEDGISFETRMGDGSDPDQGMFGKLFSAGKRLVTGESLFMTHFTNEDGARRSVAFSAPVPGSVLAVDLSEVGGEIVCQRDSFLVAAGGPLSILPSVAGSVPGSLVVKGSFCRA
tara:strand:- start:368 stop:859 length:492 start_codon:yes stop_codon:yes gene_type:complete